jgi:hypothetical protein
MAERQDLLTIPEIAKIIADKYSVPTEAVEDIIITFVKMLYEGMKGEFEFPDP